MRRSVQLVQRTMRLMFQNSLLETPTFTLRPNLPALHLSTTTKSTFTSPVLRRNALPPSMTELFYNNISKPRSTTEAFRLNPFRNASRSSRRHFSTTRPRFSQQTGPGTAAEEKPLSLSDRLRKLSREYGWSAFGIYMALSALDFPFCFLAVQAVGADRIGKWEHAVIEWVKRAVPINWPGKEREIATAEADLESVAMAPSGYDHGYKEAEQADQGADASLWTKLVLAYAIHKSFIFIRVPATVAVTPKVVKTLRSWGWNIGKRTPKAEREAKKAAQLHKKAIEEASKKH